MKNILLIGANKKEFAKKFEERKNIRRILIVEKWYKNLYSSDKYRVIKYVKSINDFVEVLEATKEIHKLIKIDSIIAVSERAIPITGYLRDCFGIEGISYKDTLIFTDKYFMKKKFSKLGYSLSCTKLNKSKINNYKKFPIIIKPRYGSAAKGVQKINNLREFEMALKSVENENVIVEPYMNVKKEFHIDSIVINGKVSFYSISEYFTPILNRKHDDILGSFMINKKHPLFHKLSEMNINIIKSLNLNSSYVTHAEFLLDEYNNLCLGEIACRPGGGKITELISVVYNIDFDQMVIELALNTKSKLHERLNELKNKANVNRVNAWLGLPIKAGVISNISEKKIFNQMNGVFDSNIELKKGDIVNKKFNSCSHSGHVLFKADTIVEIMSIKNEIESKFELTTVERSIMYE